MSEFVEYTDPVWRGLNMRALKVDEAYVVLKNYLNQTVYLYTRWDKCHTCCYSKVKVVPPTVEVDDPKESLLKVNVDPSVKFRLFDENIGKYAFDNQTSICDFYRDDLKEFGVYNLTVSADGICTMVTDKEGVNVNLSLLSVFLLIMLTLITVKIGWCAWRSYRYIEQSTEPTETAQQELPTPEEHHRRLECVDAIRGMAVVLMIFANSGGGAYWWIEHAIWNGLHVSDVVFPLFLWVMGACIPMSVRAQLRRNISKPRIAVGIAVRSSKLFMIGVCLNSVHGTPLEELRIMGVLQRIAIASLVCGLVHVMCSEKEYLPPQTPWQRAIHEFLILKVEFVVMLLLIVTHLAILFGLPVPNCPKGYMGPGGKSENASHPHCIGGAAAYIDAQVLGPSHIYKRSHVTAIYETDSFDPEGLFGCLLSTVHGFLGCLAGTIMMIHSNVMARITRLLYWSFALATLGGILCSFSVDAGFIPINKSLWSLSFVCITAALGYAFLALYYFIIDERYWWSGLPFVQCGKNSITLYVGSEIMHQTLPWHWSIGAMNTHFVLLLEGVWNAMLWIVIALYMDSIKFYYRI